MSSLADVEVRVLGLVGPDVAEATGLRASVLPPRIVLRGRFADRCALHGLLERLRTLEVEVDDVRCLPGSRD